MENLLWIGMVLILTGAGYLFFRKKNVPDEYEPVRKPPDSKLVAYITDPPVPCQIYVGIPAAAPTKWRRITALENETLTLEGGLTIHVGDATTFVAANAGGEMLFRAGIPLAVPDGVYLAKETVGSDAFLDDAQLRAGEKWLCVTCGPCTAQPDSPEFYSLTLTNLSQMKVRILRFGRYTRQDGKWRIATTTGGLFSSRMFRDWFGLAESEWIEPGAHVVCPQIFGGKPGEVAWAFWLETYGGTKSLIGAARN